MVTPPDNSSLYRSTEGHQKIMEHYDTSFQKMGIPYKAEFVETRFGLTHVVISGNENGRSILLWHGGNANSTAWTHWITVLAPTYQVYAVDTIGEVGQSAPIRPPKAGPAYGQWAADAVAGLGLKQANMIGASNGGWLIFKLAGVAPEVIGSAILVSSAGFRPVSLMFGLRFLLLCLTSRSPAETARRFLTLLSPPGLPPDPDMLALFELIMAHFRLERRSPSAISDVEIGRLTAPTHLMMGQYEITMAPYRVIERGLRLLPNVITAEVVPGVGHMMTHERLDRVIPRVTSFLERYAV